MAAATASRDKEAHSQLRCRESAVATADHCLQTDCLGPLLLHLHHEAHKASGQVLMAAAPPRPPRQSQLQCIEYYGRLLTVASRYSTVDDYGHSDVISISRQGPFVAGCQQRTAYLDPSQISGPGQAAAQLTVPDEANIPALLPVVTKLKRRICDCHRDLCSSSSSQPHQQQQEVACNRSTFQADNCTLET